MRLFIKNLILSVLLQCAFIFGYLYIAVLIQYSSGLIYNAWLIELLVLFMICLFIQWIVYKLYKGNPLEKEKYKDIYMGVNGVFIVIDVYLFLSALS